MGSHGGFATLRTQGAFGALVLPLMRRGREFRVIRSLGWHLGELLGKRHRVLVGRMPGGSLIVLAMEDYCHRDIYFRTNYEPELMSLFSARVGPGTVMFDIGANAGYFTFHCRDLGAEVHAFEPNPALLRLLTHSVELNNADVAVVPAACSDRAGVSSLYLKDPSNTGGSSITHRRSDQSVEVATTTLDEYADRSGVRPDVIKIDVEGHELEVLRGAEQLLRASHPTLVVETTHETYSELIEMLREWGYIPYSIRHDGSLDPVEDSISQVGYENLCFLGSSSN